jgi:choline dehydrogenase-like flavoprotein
LAQAWFTFARLLTKSTLGQHWETLDCHGTTYCLTSRKANTSNSPPIHALAEASYEPNVHGFIGPVKLGWGNDLDPGQFGQALNTTWQSLGFSWNVDPNSGNNTGLGLFPIEKDTVLQIRQDSARSYYLPVVGRPNLHAFTNTTALNINLDSGRTHHGAKGPVVAKGVNVILPSGKKQLLRSKQEVILSAGTYRTPGLLEQSGIGNPS